MTTSMLDGIVNSPAHRAQRKRVNIGGIESVSERRFDHTTAAMEEDGWFAVGTSVTANDYRPMDTPHEKLGYFETGQQDSDFEQFGGAPIRTAKRSFLADFGSPISVFNEEELKETSHEFYHLQQPRTFGSASGGRIRPTIFGKYWWDQGGTKVEVLVQGAPEVPRGTRILGTRHLGEHGVVPDYTKGVVRYGNGRTSRILGMSSDTIELVTDDADPTEDPEC